MILEIIWRINTESPKVFLKSLWPQEWHRKNRPRQRAPEQDKNQLKMNFNGEEDGSKT